MHSEFVHFPETATGYRRVPRLRQFRTRVLKCSGNKRALSPMHSEFVDFPGNCGRGIGVFHAFVIAVVDPIRQIGTDAIWFIAEWRLEDDAGVRGICSRVNYREIDRLWSDKELYLLEPGKLFGFDRGWRHVRDGKGGGLCNQTFRMTRYRVFRKGSRATPPIAGAKCQIALIPG